MRFDIVHTLEIPQGATELTTSQLELISGGHQHQSKNSKHKNTGRSGKSNKSSKSSKYGKYNHANSYGGDSEY
jgi:hypothetical protein